MNEKEFDIYVRNLLQNAEENVSPSVWKGVEAGLSKPRRAVVPFWRRVAVSVAAAAAAVAGFVFLKPAAPVPAEHSNPTISIASVPEVTVPLTKEELTPVEIPVARRSAAPHGSVSAVPSLQEEPVAATELIVDKPVKTTPSAAVAIAPSSAPSSDVDVQSAFNQLAFQDRQASYGRGLSLLASASIQGNERGQVGVPGGRRPAAPALGSAEGIQHETPETGFRLPFSVGIGLKYNFTPRWAVSSGLRYTNLSRTFMGDYVSSEGFAVPMTDIDNEQHWIGVPLNVHYDIVNRGRWRVHAFAGGSAEWLVDNDFLIHNSPKDLHFHQKGVAPQWSAGAGFGVEFKLTPLVGFYLDPSFRYYFNTENQPRSLRTIQPLRFDIEAGLRFSLGER